MPAVVRHGPQGLSMEHYCQHHRPLQAAATAWHRYLAWLLAGSVLASSASGGTHPPPRPAPVHHTSGSNRSAVVRCQHWAYASTPLGNLVWVPSRQQPQQGSKDGAEGSRVAVRKQQPGALQADTGMDGAWALGYPAG